MVTVMGVAVFVIIITPLGRNYFDLHLPPAEIMWIVLAIIFAAAWMLVAAAVAVRRFGPD